MVSISLSWSLPADIEPATARLVRPLLAISLPSLGVLPRTSLMMAGTAVSVFLSRFIIAIVNLGLSWGNDCFESTNAAFVLVKCHVGGGLMVIDRLLQRVQVNTLDSLLGPDVDHQLVPLFDLGRLVVDRVVDPGQKQADDRRDDELFVPAEIWLKQLGPDCLFLLWFHGDSSPDQGL